MVVEPPSKKKSIPLHGSGEQGVGVGVLRGCRRPSRPLGKLGEDAISGEICKGLVRTIEIFTKHSQKPLKLPQIQCIHVAHCCLPN